MTEIKDLTERAGYWLATKPLCWQQSQVTSEDYTDLDEMEVTGTAECKLKQYPEIFRLLFTGGLWWSPTARCIPCISLSCYCAEPNCPTLQMHRDCPQRVRWYCSSAGAKSDTNPFLQIGLSRGRERQTSNKMKHTCLISFQWQCSIDHTLCYQNFLN